MIRTCLALVSVLVASAITGAVVYAQLSDGQSANGVVTAWSGSSGPLISFGAPVDNGSVSVPVVASNAPAPYRGFALRLTWSGPLGYPNVQGQTMGGGGCQSANYGSSTNGIACFYGSGQTSKGGLLATVVFPVNGTGCASVHIVTLGSPDSGSLFGQALPGHGSYTFVDAAAQEPQSNTYASNLLFAVGGGTCPTPTSTVTSTATETETPTPCPDLDGDEVCDSVDPDADGDGCPNSRELATGSGAQNAGGNRNPYNPWDYFNPTGDGENRVDDIVAVTDQYYIDSGNPSYAQDTDRTLVGPNAWNLGPPNGLQRVDDILNIVKQYYHDCA